MRAEVRKVAMKDDPMNPFVIAIVLDVEEYCFNVIWHCLKRAGFKLKNWRNKQIVVYTNKKQNEKK